MSRPTTVVEHAADEVAFRIASGAYAPGSKLPSVRQLAKEYGINPSTVQVVLGRLQAAGLVDALPRVGFVVRDIRLLGGIETWSYLFRFSQRLPDLAASMLQDVLATRLMFVGSSLHRIASEPRRFDSTAVRRAIDQLELLVGSGAGDLDHMAQAELHAVRMIIVTAGHDVGLAVFNSIGEMILAVPEVVQALYSEPATKIMAWRAFLQAWDDGTLSEETATNIETVIGSWDVGTVKRFRDILAQEQRPVRNRRRKAASA